MKMFQVVYGVEVRPGFQSFEEAIADKEIAETSDIFHHKAVMVVTIDGQITAAAAFPLTAQWIAHANSVEFMAAH